jgi:hypothetical protein
VILRCNGRGMPVSCESRHTRAIREMSETLAQMGQYCSHRHLLKGQDDIVIRVAKVHRTGPFRPQRNIKVGPSAVKFLLDFAVLRWLCRLIQSEPIDIIHRHNYEGTVIGVLAGWITRRPVPRRHVSGQMFYLSNQLTTRSLTAMGIFTAFATY